MHQRLLQLILGMLVDVFLIISHDGLGDGLTDGVDLRGVTSSGDADANVDAFEFIGTDDQEGFIDL